MSLLPPSTTLFPSRRSSDLTPRSTNGSLSTAGSRPTPSRHLSSPGARGYRAARRFTPSERSTGFGSTKRNRRHESRSEEHTSELQSQSNLVCRLLLEKKKNN